MTGLTGALLRLVTAGVVCGILLSLGGKGPLREILRFGCACVAVMVLLTVLRQSQLPAAALSGYEGQLQARVEQAQRETRQAVLSQAGRAMEEELERQAAAYSLDCTITVHCMADRDGTVTVDRVEVHYGSGPRDRLQELRRAIAGQLALPEEHIIVKEEDGS